MRQKGFTSIFLLIVFVLLGIGFYFFVTHRGSSQEGDLKTPIVSNSSFPSTTAKPTVVNTDFIEYKDQKYGFHLSYPGNMKKEESSTENVFYLTTPDYNAEGGYQIQVTVLVKDIPTIQYYQKIMPNSPESTFLLKQEVSSINGYPVVVRTYKDGWSRYKKYYVYSNKEAVLFQGTGKDHSILDHIVTTFSFTK